MLVSPKLLDPGIGLLVLALYWGAAAATIIFVIVVLIEALILQALDWAPELKSVIASIVMNLLSIAVGILIYALAVNFDLAPDLRVVLDSLLGAILLWIAAWVVSFVSEAVLLQAARTRGEPRRKSWNASLIANSASYGFLGVAALVFPL